LTGPSTTGQTEEQKNIYNEILVELSNDVDGRVKKTFEEILAWEREHPPKGEYDGWEWWTVHADPRTLNRWVTRRILKVVLKTNKVCYYRAYDLTALEKALADYEGAFTQEKVIAEEQIPPDLFRIIIGHDDKKEIIMRSISAEKPVHCLLWGSVASAKTLMLEELARLPRSRFILGSSLTRAGLFDVLFNERPRYLIIDELEKIDDIENLSALLSLMHKGYVTETKYKRHRTVRLKTWVFASANDISRLPKELLSRFALLRFRDYNDDEFREVTVNVLKEQEDIPENLGVYIAEKVLRELSTRDVRDAVRCARLLKTKTKEEVDNIIMILKKQK
jgi:hypothetical protein